jgi:flagellar assembly factor FliW
VPLLIESSRFGQVQIDAHSVVEFPNGLVGLGGSRYALLATDEQSPFLWLHSVDDPELALPVTNPHNFFASFELELSDKDAAELGLGELDHCEVYVTVRATERPADFTANLKAPILIRSGRGDQVINRAPGSVLRAPLFGERGVVLPPPEPGAA